MKYKIFEVAKLSDGNNATIIGFDGKDYNVEITDENGITKGTKIIKENEIEKIIYTRN